MANPGHAVLATYFVDTWVDMNICACVRVCVCLPVCETIVTAMHECVCESVCLSAYVWGLTCTNVQILMFGMEAERTLGSVPADGRVRPGIAPHAATERCLVDSMSSLMEPPILVVLMVDGAAGCQVPLTSTQLCTMPLHHEQSRFMRVSVPVCVYACVYVCACSHEPT